MSADATAGATGREDVDRSGEPAATPSAGFAPDVPEAAGRRIGHGPFTSGLSTADLAAAVGAGLEPLDLVQGFCVMQWSWSSMLSGGYFPGVTMPQPRGAYGRQWACPHGFVSAEHRQWGANMEQDALESAWATGFGTALHRLLEEAQGAGAHGVIGVRDVTRGIADLPVVEFHLTGTAVRVRDAPEPAGDPWSTYLSGQRFSKLIEAGWMPVGVVGTLASVYIYESCVTELQLQWGNAMSGYSVGSGEIDQLSEARRAAVAIARRRVQHQLGSDELHGAAVSTTSRHSVAECAIRGTRVRRFKPFDPVAPPAPTVRLS